MSFIVAIDGPAGVGKGTITKLVAEKLGFVTIDTGAMYRCVTLEALNKNIGMEEIDKIKDLMDNISIKLDKVNDKQVVYLNDSDVTKEIRTEKVDKYVSKYCTIPYVREKITLIQRKMGEEGNIIMEGRDIGTVVFPNADVKIFLDAELEEVAKRRYKQNLERGIDTPFEIVLQEIKERNERDKNREIAPLKQAEDAIYIDTTNLNIEQVVNKVIEIVKSKL